MRWVISRWGLVFFDWLQGEGVGFVRKLSMIGLLKRWMRVFLRAYYQRGEGVGQLKNCAYYIIETELHAGDSLKFVTRGVWLWETNEDSLVLKYKWLCVMVYGTGETGSQTTTGVAILSADVWSSLEFWVWGPKKSCSGKRQQVLSRFLQ